MQPGDKVFLMRNGEIVEDTICHVLLTENETLLSFSTRWTPTNARPPEWVRETEVFQTLPQLLAHLEKRFKDKEEALRLHTNLLEDRDDGDDEYPMTPKKKKHG